MKAGISSNKNGDELGVFLEEASYGHHHVRVHLGARVAVPEEDEMLPARLGRKSRLLEGNERTAGRGECCRILQHQTAVKMKCSGQVTHVILVCRTTINNKELETDKF